jgi:hypothetical protein
LYSVEVIDEGGPGEASMDTRSATGSWHSRACG